MPSPRLLIPLGAWACLLVLAVAAGAAGQPADPEAQPEPSRLQRYVNFLAQAEQIRQAGKPELAGLILTACPAEDRGWEWHYLKRACKTGRASLTLPPGEHGSAFSPDGYGFAADGP